MINWFNKLRHHRREKVEAEHRREALRRKAQLSGSHSPERIPFLMTLVPDDTSEQVARFAAELVIVEESRQAESSPPDDSSNSSDSSW